MLGFHDGMLAVFLVGEGGACAERQCGVGAVSRESSISGLHGAWASCPVSEPWPPHLPIRDNPPELLGADVK